MQNKKVLVVDDNQFNRNGIINLIVNSHNIRIEEAVNGLNAVEKV